MKTFPQKNEHGVQWAFDIENIYISVRKIAALLSAVEGVSNIKLRRLFDFGNEYHVEFDYKNRRYVVWEPWGDSSVYWIGPKEEPYGEIDISKLEDIFKKYVPPLIIKIMGDLVSLKFRELFRKTEKGP